MMLLLELENKNVNRKEVVFLSLYNCIKLRFLKFWSLKQAKNSAGLNFIGNPSENRLRCLCTE